MGNHPIVSGRTLRSTIGVVVLLGIIHYLRLPTSTLMGRVLIDLGHVPVFAAIAYLLLGFLDSRDSQSSGSSRFWTFTVAALVIAILAVASELAQSMNPERSASFQDMLRNCAGGALAILVTAALSARAPNDELSRRRRLCLAAAGIIVILVMAPTAYAMAAYANRSLSWPLILGNNYRLDRAFVGAYQTNMQIALVPQEWRMLDNEFAFHVQPIAPGESGVLLQELDRDWGEFSEVCFEITNPDGGPFQARIKFGDHRMLFRSAAFRDVPLSFADKSRSTECVNVDRQARYRSLGMIWLDPNRSRQILLHRIWLQ